jgi:hypothetical protein
MWEQEEWNFKFATNYAFEYTKDIHFTFFKAFLSLKSRNFYFYFLPQ